MILTKIDLLISKLNAWDILFNFSNDVENHLRSFISSRAMMIVGPRI